MLDFYLTRTWCEAVGKATPARHSYYLDIAMVKMVVKEKLDSDLRTLLLLPADAVVPKNPVLFLHEPTGHSNTYQLILFDYEKEEVFVFGYNTPLETNLYADWDSWQGPIYWKAIAKLCSWKLHGVQSPKVIEPNWARV